MIEQTASATGHRDIFNNGATYHLTHSSCKKVAETITPRLESLISNGVDRFITGGALGFDQIVFFAVEKLKSRFNHIKNILALPHVGQDVEWQSPQRSWFESMLKRADQIIYVDELPDYQIRNHEPGYHPSKMIMRDRYMIDNSKYLVACYDGRKGGGSRLTLEYAKLQSGRIIYRFNPLENMNETIIHGGRK